MKLIESLKSYTSARKDIYETQDLLFRIFCFIIVLLYELN